MSTAHLLQRKTTHFVLWRPQHADPPPTLVIGKLQQGNPPTFVDEQQFALSEAADAPGRWEIAASACDLTDGQVYHYWFEVNDSSPGRDARQPHPLHRPDRLDRRLAPARAPAARPVRPTTTRTRPASSCSGMASSSPATPAARSRTGPATPPSDTRPTNNRLVIYELPTAWSLRGETGGDPQSASAPSATSWP